MQDETEETKFLANRKEDSIPNVSKKKKKSRKKKTSLSELTIKETMLYVDADGARNCEETNDEIEQNCGLEVLQFMQEEATVEELCVCLLKEFPADVVKGVLRKLRQNKTREMKLIVALVMEEIRMTKNKSIPSKFKKKKKRKKPVAENQLMPLETKSFADGEVTIDDLLQKFNYSFTCCCEGERTKYQVFDKDLCYDDADTPSDADTGIVERCTTILHENRDSDHSTTTSEDDDTLVTSTKEDQLELSRSSGNVEQYKTVFYENDGSDISTATCESETTDSHFEWPTIFEYSFQLLATYEEIINELIITFDLYDDEVEAAINFLNYNYRNVYKGQTPSVIDFNDIRNCVGYLHRFAPCHAALVKKEVSQVICSSSGIVSKLESKREMNIVCLGGGPGNDLVGLLSAFTGLLSHGCGRCDFTVVDKMAGWSKVFSLTIQKFVHEHFDLLRSAFFVADLTNFQTWGGEMKEKLKKADVMTMVKVLSNIPETDRLEVLENVVRHMKPGAMLFFIDCPPPPQELFYRNPSLEMRHETKVNKFDFAHKKFKFGHHNITTCRAATYVIERHNANKSERVPDLDDVIEWPTLA